MAESSPSPVDRVGPGHCRGWRRRRFLTWLLVLAVSAQLCWNFLAFSPYPELGAFASRGFSARILDREGGLMAILPAPDGLRREWLDLPRIPDSAQRVFVASEDARFYLHSGVDLPALLRSLAAWLSGRPSGGASTITMQLARMIAAFTRSPGASGSADTGNPDASGPAAADAGSQSRSFGSRVAVKATEMLDALRIEARLPKARILELYLNNLPFGSGAEGLASASRDIFGKPLSSLSAREVCTLAVVPRLPSRYDPRRNPEASKAAATRLAARLPPGIFGSEAPLSVFLDVDPDLSSDRILEGTGLSGSAPGRAPVRPSPATPDLASSLAPHFIRYWFSESNLPASLSWPDADSPQSMPTPHNSARPARAAPDFGIRAESAAQDHIRRPAEIRSSIDPRIQSRLLYAIRSRVAENKEERISTGSGLVLDNRTGEILAWVGSADFFDTEARGQIDGVRVANQPGSCLKPFLYAAAIEEGFTPATILQDIPTDFGSGSAYVPLNFNNRFNGPVRLRVALASSLNVPAVRTLEALGVARFVDYLSRLGIESVVGEADRAGLGIALGAAGVTLYELVRAFAVFPRGGVALDPMPLYQGASRDDQSGVYPQGFPGRLVMDPYAAGIIRDILSDQKSRFTGFAHGRLFDRPYSAMFKTGTANQFQHVWALGATARYTVGIWMGNFTGQTVSGARTASVPATAVVEVLDAIADRKDRFPPIPAAREYLICAQSGELATPACTSTLREYFARSGPAPKPCHIHGADRAAAALEHGIPEASFADSAQVRGSDSGASVSVFRSKVSGATPRFLHPAEGAVFYLDASIPPEDQVIGIRLEGLGSLSGDLWVRVENSGQASDGPLPARLRLSREGTDRAKVLLPLVRGSFVLQLEHEGRSLARVAFRVE